MFGILAERKSGNVLSVNELRFVLKSDGALLAGF